MEITTNNRYRFYFTTGNPIFNSLYQYDDGYIYTSDKLKQWFEEQGLDRDIDYVMEIDINRSNSFVYSYYYEFFDEPAALMFKLAWYKA